MVLAQRCHVDRRLAPRVGEQHSGGRRLGDAEGGHGVAVRSRQVQRRVAVRVHGRGRRPRSQQRLDRLLVAVAGSKVQRRAA